MKDYNKTRIAGYCASSTECFDHSLSKKNFFKLVSLFLRGVIEGKDLNEKKELEHI